jgi:hypothetical protein
MGRSWEAGDRRQEIFGGKTGSFVNANSPPFQGGAGGGWNREGRVEAWVAELASPE